MIEKFTEDMFNLHYFSIHRKRALHELFKIIYILRMEREYRYTDIPHNNRKKNIYLSDKFLSYFMRKLHKPSLTGDL